MTATTGGVITVTLASASIALASAVVLTWLRIV